MAKRPPRRRRKKARRRSNERNAQKRKRKDKESATTGPWLSRRTGLFVIGALSLGMAAFTAWQLYPTEGLGGSLLWGIGFGVALWLVFFLSLAFNRWVRRDRH